MKSKSRKDIEKEKIDKLKKEIKHLSRPLTNSKPYRVKNVKLSTSIDPKIPEWAKSRVYKSYPSGVDKGKAKPIVKYEGEMLDREKEAIKEIERKKKRVAILYNKSGYYYLGDNPAPEIIKGLGKK